ncbi:MAG TPA: preprotein translocase subunit YajC [Gaiellaceae bacterium]|jgi:preprotein translocase subunit YajC
MSGPGFLLIIVAFAFLYFVLIRPQKKRQLQSRQMLDTIKVGDEVVTAAGIYGRVAELVDDDIMVDIAPNVRVKVARRAIGAVIPPAAELEEPEQQQEEPPAADNGR